MIIEFTKMHGLGNDFIIIENFKGISLNYRETAKDLCRRRFSIGADGLVILEKSQCGDLRMRIFNPDGSEAEMCGNAIRCVAKYAFENKIVLKKDLEVETGAGIIKPSIIDGKAGELSIRVDMGRPVLKRSSIPVAGKDSPHVINEIINVEGEEFQFCAVSMGNPHCVIFVDEITDRLVRDIGPKIEMHALFPEKTNVEFVVVNSPDHINMRVWERGAGETPACGTGACASVVAGILRNLLRSQVRVSLPGGDLIINWCDCHNVFMTGPAEESFRGGIFHREI